MPLRPISCTFQAPDPTVRLGLTDDAAGLASGGRFPEASGRDSGPNADMRREVSADEGRGCGSPGPLLVRSSIGRPFDATLDCLCRRSRCTDHAARRIQLHAAQQRKPVISLSESLIWGRLPRPGSTASEHTVRPGGVQCVVQSVT